MERCNRPLRTIFVFTFHHHLVMAVSSHSTHTHIHTGHRHVISTAILSQTCLQDEAIHASLKTGELRNFSKASQPSYNRNQSGRHLFQDRLICQSRRWKIIPVSGVPPMPLQLWISIGTDTTSRQTCKWNCRACSRCSFNEVQNNHANP